MKTENMIGLGVGVLTVLIAAITIVCLSNANTPIAHKPILTARQVKQAELRYALKEMQRHQNTNVEPREVGGGALTQDEISACYIAVGRGHELPRSWRKHYYDNYCDRP